ncbi:hypothetical protein DID80_06030 [Candidatus Marinamargulisbacteria bacterium SCGC AAA071-K20]|nr:hypothetical protein DID80_06030 [Candidatus Marinamargulisbacteria bacterium SCGC AAA071-K20]
MKKIISVLYTQPIIQDCVLKFLNGSRDFSPKVAEAAWNSICTDKLPLNFCSITIPPISKAAQVLSTLKGSPFPEDITFESKMFATQKGLLCPLKYITGSSDQDYSHFPSLHLHLSHLTLSELNGFITKNIKKGAQLTFFQTRLSELESYLIKKNLNPFDYLVVFRYDDDYTKHSLFESQVHIDFLDQIPIGFMYTLHNGPSTDFLFPTNEIRLKPYPPNKIKCPDPALNSSAYTHIINRALLEDTFPSLTEKIQSKPLLWNKTKASIPHCSGRDPNFTGGRFFIAVFPKRFLKKPLY